MAGAVILRVLASFLWELDTNPCLDMGQCTHYFQPRIVFFLSRIDLVISTLSLNYLRVIFCNPCSADKFHENNSSLQNYNSFRFCVAFLSNAKLQLLQYWTVSLNNRIVVFHHEFFWLFGQGSMINRNSQFPVNADTVLVSASCLR